MTVQIAEHVTAEALARALFVASAWGCTCHVVRPRVYRVEGDPRLVEAAVGAMQSAGLLVEPTPAEA